MADTPIEVNDTLQPGTVWFGTCFKYFKLGKDYTK